AEILWTNRDRLEAGSRLHGIRQVMVPTEQDRQARLVTNAQIRLVRQRTAAINLIKALLRQFNLMHDCPTKTFQTKAVKAWLRSIELPDADKMILELALDQWELLDRQIETLAPEVDRRADASSAAQVIKTIPGAGSLTSLVLASRIG
ncbi:MAG: hypothetical protein GWM88_13780, partial [Pseudomonadales bacterium]|nr:transposase [Pseudomonadales bacterium]NIX09011.1 hypothetical protein [Pseudomonadales bacterium]